MICLSIGDDTFTNESTGNDKISRSVMACNRCADWTFHDVEKHLSLLTFYSDFSAKIIFVTFQRQ